MRELIRPTLFLVVRLALFFAVLAWLISMSTFNVIRLVLWGQCFAVWTEPPGCCVGINKAFTGIPCGITYFFNLPSDDSGTVYFEPNHPDAAGYRRWWLLPGLMFVKGKGFPEYSVSGRHWLNIMLCVLAYAGLKRVYRKPPAVVPN